MTPPNPEYEPKNESIERTAELCAHINRELHALGEDATFAVPFILNWMIGNLARAAYSEHVHNDRSTDPAPLVRMIEKSWAEGLTDAADKAGALH